jgi:hypothetical protein
MSKDRIFLFSACDGEIENNNNKNCSVVLSDSYLKKTYLSFSTVAEETSGRVHC